MAPAKSRTRRTRMRVFIWVCGVLIVAGIGWRVSDGIVRLMEIRADRQTASSTSSPVTQSTGEDPGSSEQDVGFSTLDEYSFSPGQTCDANMDSSDYAAFVDRLLAFGEIRMMVDDQQKLDSIQAYVTQDYFDYYVPPLSEESDLNVRNVFDRDATQVQCYIESGDATVLYTKMVPAVTTFGTVDGSEVVLEQPSSEISYGFIWVKVNDIWYVNQEN